MKILPDLSRATLQRRAMLRPLLHNIRKLGGTYRWGYPIALIVRKGSSSFVLQHPADLPELFSFLEIETFAIPNWLQPILRPMKRSVTLGAAEEPLPQATGRSGGPGGISQSGGGQEV